MTLAKLTGKSLKNFQENFFNLININNQPKFKKKMKNTPFKLMALMLGIMVSAISFTSCDKDDDDKGNPPVFKAFTVAADNASANVIFDEAVYKADNKSGNLDKASFSVTIAGGTATLADYTVTHTAGSNEAIIVLKTSGIANGEEVVTMQPASANSIYNADGDAMLVATMTANLNDIGIIGKWVSGGDHVAPLLIYAGIDSVYADFRGDNTYLVESFTPDGSKTTLTGTFTQQRSAVAGIWNITVNQSSPNALVSEGIFQILDQNPLMMKYEIAQTDPVIVGVTPPTAAEGFGSTSAGAFGVMNIQTYLKVN
jgi:hypothetical protein